MRQFSEEMTPVRIAERGQCDERETAWRVCTFGDDNGHQFRVSVTGPVIALLTQAPYDYDTDDIVVAFVEMAHESGHTGGEFFVRAETVEYHHLIAYIQTLG